MRRPAHILTTWQKLERYWAEAKDDFDYPIDRPLLRLDTLEGLETNVNKIVGWLAKEEIKHEKT